MNQYASKSTAAARRIKTSIGNGAQIINGRWSGTGIQRCGSRVWINGDRLNRSAAAANVFHCGVRSGVFRARHDPFPIR